jgi:hypothetical protein
MQQRVFQFVTLMDCWSRFVVGGCIHAMFISTFAPPLPNNAASGISFLDFRSLWNLIDFCLNPEQFFVFISALVHVALKSKFSDLIQQFLKR